MYWIPFEIESYLGDTRQLTVTEHGLYLLMLMENWRGKPLPLDLERIYKIVGANTEAEKKPIGFLISTFFEKKHDGFWNENAFFIYEKQKSRQKRLKENGAKGGRPLQKQDSKKNNQKVIKKEPSGLYIEIEIEKDNLYESKLSTQLKNKFSESDELTAIDIFDKLKKLNPEIKQPNLNSWSEEIRKMRELDKRSDDLIRKVFYFANSHSFWQAVVLSPSNLRKNFDKLLIQMNQSKPSVSIPVATEYPVYGVTKF